MSEPKDVPAPGSIAAKMAAAEAKRKDRKPAGAAPGDNQEADTQLAGEPASQLAGQPASSVRSELASRPASEPASSGLPPMLGSTVALADLVGGGVDPSRDLVAAGARVPRYLKAALASTASLTKNSRTPMKEQDILTAALLAYLPEDIVKQAWDNASSNRGFS